jgi:hypothetical protein
MPPPPPLLRSAAFIAMMITLQQQQEPQHAQGHGVTWGDIDIDIDIDINIDIGGDIWFRSCTCMSGGAVVVVLLTDTMIAMMSMMMDNNNETANDIRMIKNNIGHIVSVANNISLERTSACVNKERAVGGNTYTASYMLLVDVTCFGSDEEFLDSNVDMDKD